MSADVEYPIRTPALRGAADKAVAAWELELATPERVTLTGIQDGEPVTAPWIDATERVAWLNWTHRAWGVETPVSGDALARSERKFWDSMEAKNNALFNGPVVRGHAYTAVKCSASDASTYLCTLDEGHLGPHEAAGASGLVYSVWES